MISFQMRQFSAATTYAAVTQMENSFEEGGHTIYNNFGQSQLEFQDIVQSMNELANKEMR